MVASNAAGAVATGGGGGSGGGSAGGSGGVEAILSSYQDNDSRKVIFDEGIVGDYDGHAHAHRLVIA